ncbi:MAG: dihydroorotate dehydrogenase electron transfer subunit [Clostridia bacterium]|nr:dihydroorotate dehydrogenase electron transfer subunit [Clostridia bacterium]
MRELELTITQNIKIAENIYRMDFSLTEGVGAIQCGQFLNLSLNRPDLLLKRPFGICSYDKDGRSITICYQLAGKGTQEMSTMQAGDKLMATLPLGNGFKLCDSYKKVALIGGGVGIFPLLSVPLNYPDKEYYSFLGYRSKSFVCMKKEFEAFCCSRIATDDGSLGQKGNAVELFLSNYDSIKPDVILACGPTVMLKALKKGLKENNINTPAFVSLEERMGCGVGACLVCVCQLEKREGVAANARVCKDGPVFNILEVEL